MTKPKNRPRKRRPYEGPIVAGKDLSLKKLRSPATRSAITNGALTVFAVDCRQPWVRRLKDLIAASEADMGGAANMSNVEVVLLRRASFLVLQLELMEASIAERNNGKASPRQLNEYQRVLSAIRRVYHSLLGKDGGLKRRQQDITPVSHSELQGMLIDA